jgi:peptidoglycan/LPS O-acetylase OafA/YrhL
MGLDGLRGYALMSALLFHLKFPWATGALFGVSLFFTVSGYLITQILLGEVHRTGRVDLLRFWSRRVRRLLPAAALCLALVVIVSLTFTKFANGSTRGDVVAAIFNVSNWRFVANGSSYDDIFLSGPSPLVHFWSLAVEEQFYLLLPILVAVTARLRPKALPLVIAVVAALSLLASALSQSHTLIYYGTHIRAFELLAGALLAFAVPLNRPVSRAVQRFAQLSCLPAFVAFAVLVGTTTTTDSWLYSGGLQAFSLISCVLIVGVVAPATPLRWLAELRPIVWVGKLSYGLYVFHWPIFQLLTNERLGINGVALAMVRLGVTAAVALASFHLLEQRVRHPSAVKRRGRGVATYIFATAALIVVVVVSPGINARQPVLAGVGISNAPVIFSAPSTAASTATVTADSLPVTVPTTIPKEKVKVLILGSRTTIAASLDTVVSSRYEIEIEDRSEKGCQIVIDTAASLSALCAAQHRLIENREGYDLVVVGLGAVDRTGLPEDTVINQENRALAYGLLEPAMSYLNRVMAGGGPVVFDDPTTDDALAVLLRDLDSVNPNVSLISAEDPTSALETAIAAQTSANVRADSALKLLVIGDSTSFGMASALATAAGDKLHVLWGGGQNCPLVQVAELRWWKGAQWNLDRCPTPRRGWPDLVSSFQPDLVLIIASLPEQSEQRYVAGGPWFTAGDPEFVKVHNEEMLQLQQLLAPSGTLTLVATAPAIVNGAFAGGTLGSPIRIAAWNEQMASWDQQWGSVSTIDWAGAVGAAEAEGYTRPDGVHFEQDKLDKLIADYVLDGLLATADALAEQAKESGCVTPLRHLNLEQCAIFPTVSG